MKTPVLAPATGCKPVPLSGAPRRFVRMVKGRFVDLVLSGEKRMTVRPTPKRMPEPGDIIDLRTWDGSPYRSKTRRLLCRWIQAVEKVTIRKTGYKIEAVGDLYRRFTTVHDFAKADGFLGWPEMVDFFQDEYVMLPFYGILIHWGVEEAPAAP